jgi:hypothetical protein
VFLIYVVDGFFCLVPFTDPVRVFFVWFPLLILYGFFLNIFYLIKLDIIPIIMRDK